MQGARPLRIVIVEDHDDGRVMLKMTREEAGHEVHAAADGLSGLDLSLARKPHVSSVDIGLPGSNGYEIARRVHKAEGEARPVLLALSGYGQPHDKLRAHEAGFDEHMIKPVYPADLLR